jgi:flagella basal body P-ring formation protein FlgA
MRPFAFCMLCCFARFVHAQVPPCESVESTSIRAKDLAHAVEVFAAVPPDTVVAHAPVPGARRILRGAEILQLARKHSLPLETAPDVCFAWPMEALDRSRVLEAMHKALDLPDATVKLIEISLQPAPRGELSFSAARIGIPARPDRASPVLWRGDVIYGGGHRFSVWAKVEITAPVTRIVAAVALKSGEPILPGHVRAETSKAFPVLRNILTLDSVIGRSPVRAIPAGTELRSVDLSSPRAVNSGDSVNIEVRSGNTRLALTGIALTPGSVGDTISVRNLESKKVFRAQVTGTGNAVVQPGGIREN